MWGRWEVRRARGCEERGGGKGRRGRRGGEVWEIIRGGEACEIIIGSTALERSRARSSEGEGIYLTLLK